MKKRIMAAALAVLIVSGFAACTGTKEPATTTTAVSSATTAQTLTTSEPQTTVAETTTEPTTVVQTVTEILTTTKRVITTKAPTTKAPTTAVTTTVPVFDENKPEDYYRIIENAFKEDLKYGVYRRRAVTSYIEELDGMAFIVKQDISEYYNRLLYRADYNDLLPAANENKELYSQAIGVVLDIINGYRAEQNIAPLVLSDELTEIACARAEEIAWSGEHSHRRPNGKAFSSILKDAGITTGIAGENIGWGYDTAEAVCTAWKNSQSHFENIMNPEFVKIGIGVAADPDPNGKLCWTQLFMSE